MNAEDAKSYLAELLPGYTINIIENFKGQPNNRYVFTKDGVDAAMLFARKLNMTKELLQEAAMMVQKRFNTPKSTDTVQEPKNEVAEETSSSDGNQPALPTELELSFYEAAKKVVKDFEGKYPMH